MPHQPGSSGLLRVTFNIFEVFKDIFTLQTNSDASNDRNKQKKKTNVTRRDVTRRDVSKRKKPINWYKLNLWIGFIVC